MDIKSKKALIAMSGGVDSSVAAYLVKREGYECLGCTMKLYNNENTSASPRRTCCSVDDVEDAGSVAAKIDIPYYVFNFTEEFGEKVIKGFVKSYESGATPNPCIDCNRYLKFDKLYDRARFLDCEYIVTGHYARIEYDGDSYVLKKAVDETKDQSYVLYFLTQEQLGHTLFPLGGLSKAQVRDIAEQNRFVNAAKPDSQDICFVPDGKYAEFLERYNGEAYPSGDFLFADGKVLGKHKGIVRYTVGQHKGLGISSSQPLYVKRINAFGNSIILCNENDLYDRELIARDFNWISGNLPTNVIRCKAKIRYRHKEQSATAIPIDDKSVRIIFDEPQRAITVGQAAVLYEGDRVLGGGRIDEVFS